MLDHLFRKEHVLIFNQDDGSESKAAKVACLGKVTTCYHPAVVFKTICFGGSSLVYRRGSDPKPLVANPAGGACNRMCSLKFILCSFHQAVFNLTNTVGLSVDMARMCFLTAASLIHNNDF